MNTATRLGAFGAGLALAFGAAFGIGNAVGPTGSDPEPAHAGHGGEGEEEGEQPAESAGAAEAETPGGLQVSERGYTLDVPGEPLTAAERTDFRFRVLGPDGEPLTAYDTTHEKKLHLIVARRDLSGFQHIHPTLAADGTWSIPLTLDAAGSYRVFADFSPTGDPAGPLTLGADIAVTGEYEPQPLPAPARTTTVMGGPPRPSGPGGGYTVTLDGGLAAGAESALSFSVSRDGRPVTDLEPYLGASGHLVALRAGDLAYLHVHPQDDPDGITFHTQAPSTGTYRLYLDFKHGGTVHTAEFTVTTTGGQAEHEEGHEEEEDDAHEH